MKYTVQHHLKDTDDIVEEFSPDFDYNDKHSKSWNMAVDRATKALEKQLAEADRQEQEKERQATIEKAKKEAYYRMVAEERRRREEMLKKGIKPPQEPKKKTMETVDLNELYKGLTDDADVPNGYKI